MSEKRVQQPSTDHHNAYREYAMTVNRVTSWRDALEQAVLLEDSVKIQQDFTALRKAMDSSMMSIEDEYEVVLPELRKIDNSSALEREPDFRAWVCDVARRYHSKKGIAS